MPRVRGALPWCFTPGSATQTNSPLFGVARVDLVERAPAVGRVHEAVVDQRIDLVLRAVLPDVLHAAERQRPDHPQVLDVLAVDLRQLRVARARRSRRSSCSQFCGSFCGVDQPVCVDGHLPVTGDDGDARGECAADYRRREGVENFGMMLPNETSFPSPDVKRGRAGELLPVGRDHVNGLMYSSPSPLRLRRRRGLPRRARREAGVNEIRRERRWNRENRSCQRKLVQLYNEFIHGHISRREFFDGAKKLAVGAWRPAPSSTR